MHVGELEQDPEAGQEYEVVPKQPNDSVQATFVIWADEPIKTLILVTKGFVPLTKKPELAVKVTVNEYDDNAEALVGVPEITPVDEFKLKPEGKLGEISNFVAVKLFGKSTKLGVMLALDPVGIPMLREYAVTPELVVE